MYNCIVNAYSSEEVNLNIWWWWRTLEHCSILSSSCLTAALCRCSSEGVCQYSHCSTLPGPSISLITTLYYYHFIITITSWSLQRGVCWIIMHASSDLTWTRSWHVLILDIYTSPWCMDKVMACYYYCYWCYLPAQNIIIITTYCSSCIITNLVTLANFKQSGKIPRPIHR